jgi:hypothetical protein
METADKNERDARKKEIDEAIVECLKSADFDGPDNLIVDIADITKLVEHCLLNNCHYMPARYDNKYSIFRYMMTFCAAWISTKPEERDNRKVKFFNSKGIHETYFANFSYTKYKKLLNQEYV